MMKPNKLVVTLACLAMIVSIAGCDDDIQALEYHSQGFVRGSISGTASDDETAIDEDFKYTQFQQTIVQGDGYTGYILDGDGGLEATIFRQDLKTGGYIYFSFLLEDENDTTPDNINFSLAYFKESDKILYFRMYDGGENVAEISDFSFDMATGKATGSFMMKGPNNSSDNEATVEGAFDVVLKQFYQ